MEDYECTEERFLADVKDHDMHIILDQGVNRHIRFSRNNSSYYYFDLITWKGHLCVSGDCGTFVFARTEDMFDFFPMDRNDFNHSDKKKLNINPYYWSEKLLASNTGSGYEAFSSDLFRENVMDAFRTWSEGETPEKIKEVRDAIEEDILPYTDTEEEGYYSVSNFQNSDNIFPDFWEHSHRVYTFHYIWNLYAIVWGIEKYNNK